MRKCIEDVTALQLRLKKIIGQLTGVQKMLAEDVPCEDILTQINAANGALHRLSFIVLDGHLQAADRALERRFIQTVLRNGIKTGLADQDAFNDLEPVPALWADNCINFRHRSND